MILKKVNEVLLRKYRARDMNRVGMMVGYLHRLLGPSGPNVVCRPQISRSYNFLGHRLF